MGWFVLTRLCCFAAAHESCMSHAQQQTFSLPTFHTTSLSSADFGPWCLVIHMASEATACQLSSVRHSECNHAGLQILLSQYRQSCLEVQRTLTQGLPSL